MSDNYPILLPAADSAPLSLQRRPAWGRSRLSNWVGGAAGRTCQLARGQMAAGGGSGGQTTGRRAGEADRRAVIALSDTTRCREMDRHLWLADGQLAGWPQGQTRGCRW